VTARKISISALRNREVPATFDNLGKHKRYKLISRIKEGAAERVS
jgi:hypothetical protein